MTNLLFKGKKSKHFKNCPLFSEFTNLDKILINNLLNNEGIDVIYFINNIKQVGIKKNMLGFKRNYFLFRI